jgi:ferric-dicitrate binding protein FerR (iron transport regulator)
MNDRNFSNDAESNGEFDPNDLDWLAFCYLADELDEAQRAAFELRLESDEQAQNSLVAAMRESQLVFATLDSTSSNVTQDQATITLAPQAFSTQSSIAKKRFGLLIGSAAAICLLVGGWAWYSNPSNDESEMAVAISDSDQLASAWVDTALILDDESLDELIDEDSRIELDEESADWMFVALTELEDSSESLDGDNGESY